MNALHQQSLVIDGLNISKWERPVFEDMKKVASVPSIAPSRYGRIFKAQLATL